MTFLTPSGQVKPMLEHGELLTYVSKLETDISLLEAQNEKLDSDLIRYVELSDLEARARNNGKITPTDYRLFVALISTYPSILTGERIKINLYNIRHNAGEPHANTVTTFFYGLKVIGAVYCDLSAYREALTQEERRPVFIQANIDLFPFPEKFDLRDTEKRKKAREKKQQQYRDSLLIRFCESCGSEQMEYTLIPRCRTCGHVHTSIEHVPVQTITITPLESEDDFPGETFTPEVDVIAPDVQGETFTPNANYQYSPPLVCRNRKCTSPAGGNWVENRLRNKWQCGSCNEVSAFNVRPRISKGA